MFFDQRLSETVDLLRNQIGPVDIAVLKAVAITTTSIGNSSSRLT
jgi:acyl-CoA hydrolase